MNRYILKTGEIIEAIPIGRAKICIGEQNNRLTVCDRAPNTISKKPRVVCLCNCGNYTVINYQDFKEGRVKSCGCLSTEEKIKRGTLSAIDYSKPERNINPFYEYIEPTNMRTPTNSIIWKIRCRKCGKIYFDSPNELISEKRTHGNNPCLCNRKFSHGIQKILYILINNKIKFELEKKFDTCLSDKGNKLPFDIYLPDYNTLIEYDGEQHYKIAFGQNKEKLIKQKQNDKIKNDWCQSNNIKLIRIPYTKQKIELKDLI